MFRAMADLTRNGERNPFWPKVTYLAWNNNVEGSLDHVLDPGGRSELSGVDAAEWCGSPHLSRRQILRLDFLLS